MFKLIELNIGVVKVGTRHIISFPYEGVIINSLATSCGCGDAKDNKNAKQIEVSFTAQPIPEHLRRKSETRYITTKYITAQYTTDKGVSSAIVLNFTATVTI